MICMKNTEPLEMSKYGRCFLLEGCFIVRCLPLTQCSENSGYSPEARENASNESRCLFDLAFHWSRV